MVVENQSIDIRSRELLLEDSRRVLLFVVVVCLNL